MKLKPAYFEVIPTLCGDGYTMSDHGIYIYSTRKEVEDSIQEVVDEYKEQIQAGERDPEDDEVDFYPMKVYLSDTGKIFDEDKVDMTEHIHAVIKITSDIHDPTEFTNEIINYVN